MTERIPKYRLRADTLTDFAGYDNRDWIQTPALSASFDLDLSPPLINETLKYFGKNPWEGAGGGVAGLPCLLPLVPACQVALFEAHVYVCAH